MNKTQIDEAILKFKSGSNCAQSVLSTYLPTLGIPEFIAEITAQFDLLFVEENGDWLGLWRRTKTIYLRCIECRRNSFIDPDGK